MIVQVWQCDLCKREERSRPRNRPMARIELVSEPLGNAETQRGDRYDCCADCYNVVRNLVWEMRRSCGKDGGPR